PLRGFGFSFMPIELNMEGDRGVILHLFEQIKVARCRNVALAEWNPIARSFDIFDVGDLEVWSQGVKMLFPLVPMDDERVSDIKGDANLCRIKSVDRSHQFA